jgi:hypothetical protein
MISSPVNGKKSSISKLKTDYSNITSIYEYNADTKTYSNADYIEVLKGYWLKSNADIYVTLSSTENDKTITIDNINSSIIDDKWLLLGTPFDITKTDLKNRGASAVWWYDPLIKNYSTDEIIKAGSGFWIKK